MGPTRYTLLTGSTGLLGRILLADLTRARIPVAVLVRPGREGDAEKRLNSQLLRVESLLNRTFPRPVVLTGELTQPQLGLSIADRNWLQSNCDRVLHSAAYVSFKPAESHPDGEPFTTNVQGTRRLAELCQSLGIIEFHHISSAFACGLREGLVLETDRSKGQHFSNDYEASKCQTEEMLHSMGGWKSLTVYRPSIVIDPTPGSLPMGDRTIYLAFSIYQLLSQRVGLPDPVELLNQLGLKGNEHKNIVPVDWVSRLIVQIFRRSALHGQTYHLTHAKGTSLVEMLTAFHDVLVDAGYSSLQRKVADSDFGELASLVEQFLGTFSPYFRDDPQFDQQYLKKALSACGESPCPDVSRDTLQEIARQQLRRKPELATGKETELPGHDLLGAIHSSTQETPELHPTMELGLFLTGAGGGDWVIGLNQHGEFRVRAGGAGAIGRTAYLSVQTWSQLLNKQIGLEEAMRQGRVVLEGNPREESAAISLQDYFEQLLELLIDRVDSGDLPRSMSLNGN